MKFTGKAAVAALALLSMPSFAAEKGSVKEEIDNHFKLYGFIRNFLAVDTRESTAGTGDLFYYLPKDKDKEPDDNGEDLNAAPSFRFLSLTSRLGVDVFGYEYGRTKFGGKIETDFYSGLTNTATSSKINGTAQLRLRLAYMTLGWDDLRMGGRGNTASVLLTMGQAWHPLAADQPHVISLETGAPFNAFSRTPLVKMDANLGGHVTLSAAAIWQMQYLSTGPNGASAEYLKYSCVPEMYAGVSVKAGGFLARAGVDILSIKPRRLKYLDAASQEVDGNAPDARLVKAGERLTTASPFLFLQYKHKNFEAKAKTIFSQAGEHINLMGGYGWGYDDGSTREYRPLRTSSTWASMTYGKKWQFMLMGGYIRNLGSQRPLNEYWFSSNGSKDLRSMWRLIPAVAYNIGKFTVALEYNVTSAQYGKVRPNATGQTHGVPEGGLHWVANHRVQTMVKLTF